MMPSGSLPHFILFFLWTNKIPKSKDHCHTLYTFFFEAQSSRNAIQRDTRKTDKSLEESEY